MFKAAVLQCNLDQQIQCKHRGSKHVHLWSSNFTGYFLVLCLWYYSPLPKIYLYKKIKNYTRNRTHDHTNYKTAMLTIVPRNWSYTLMQK